MDVFWLNHSITFLPIKATSGGIVGYNRRVAGVHERTSLGIRCRGFFFAGHGNKFHEAKLKFIARMLLRVRKVRPRSTPTPPTPQDRGRALHANGAARADHFAPVKVNKSLTLLFDEDDKFESHHLAFHVSNREFDAILRRIKREKIAYGSAPWSLEDGKLNNWNGGRGVYFSDPNGHVLELMTVPQ
ncbi:MAG: hypothetical protein ACLQNV_08465 [Steroidobacteraceae bacterium]